MPYSALPYKRCAFYYETDKMGIVHHSNYIRWIEEARLDFMQQVGLSYEDIEKNGIIMPVIEVSCKYIFSVHYNETVNIYTKPVFFNGIKAVFRYEIYTEDKEMLAASGESSHCFLDDTTRTPVSLKKRYTEFYERGMDLLNEK
jgi:acyl-CoA thioester hydrolase